MRGNDIGLAALESARNAEQAYNVRIIGVEVLTLTMNQQEIKTAIYSGDVPCVCPVYSNSVNLRCILSQIFHVS